MFRLSISIFVLVVALGSARAEVTPSGTPEVARRDRFILGGGLATSPPLGVYLDAWAGWMLHPRIALFASGIGGEEYGKYTRYFAVGARVWLTPRLYADVRGGRLRARYDDCDLISHPCDIDEVAPYVGLGVEMLHRTRASIALHLGVIVGMRDDSPVLWADGAALVGIAVSAF